MIRAGAGIYYDGNINMNQFNDIQSGAAPFSLRYEVVNDTSQPLPARLVSNEYPGGLLGVAPQPNANPPASFRFAQPYYPIPAVYQWSFSVQQRIGIAWVAEADYVGSHTIHQFQFIDQNAADLPQGAIANVPLQQRRPYPQWGVLGTWAPLGWAQVSRRHVQHQEQPVAWPDAARQLHVGRKTLPHRTSTTPITATSTTGIRISGRARRTSRRNCGSSRRMNYHTPKVTGSKALSPVVNDWVFSGTFTAATGSPQFPVTQDLSGDRVLRRLEHIPAEPDLRRRPGAGHQNAAEMVQHGLLRRSGVRHVGQCEFRRDHRSWNQQLEYRDGEADPHAFRGIAFGRVPRGFPERFQSHAVPGVGQELAQRHIRADQRRAAAAADPVRDAVYFLIVYR